MSDQIASVELVADNASGSEPREVLPAPQPWRRAANVLALFALMTFAGVVAFGPALQIPFFADDIDLLLNVGNFRGGNVSLGEYLSENHNEHRIPVMRALMFIATMPGNLDASALHVAVLAVHVGCGTLVALLVLPDVGRRYAILAGLLFVVSGVFSSMVIWAPTSSVFSQALLSVLLARHSLANFDRWGPTLASLALLLGALTLNATVLAAVILGVAYWSRLGPTRARRLGVLAGWLLVAGIVFAWSSAHFVVPRDGQQLERIVSGLRNGAFLVFSAAARWIRSWLAGTAGEPPNIVELATTSTIAVFAIATLPRGLRKHVIVLGACAAAIAMAVGYGRSDQGFSLIYSTDRYYYAFGAPIAVVVVSILRRLLQRRGESILFGVVLIGVLTAGSALCRRIVGAQDRSPHIEGHRVGLGNARSLALLLAAEATNGPFVVRDGFIPLQGIHKGGLTMRAIVYGTFPAGVRGLGFGAPDAISDDGRLNGVLEAWARGAGWVGSPVVATNAGLQAVTRSAIDFRMGAYDNQVGKGFHAWNAGTRSRWMSRRGELTLAYAGERNVTIEAHVPLGALRNADILQPDDLVQVYANGDPIGELNFAETGLTIRTFSLPRFDGNQLVISFESSFTWNARQAYPSNMDPRELSITLFAVRLGN